VNTATTNKNSFPVVGTASDSYFVMKSQNNPSLNILAVNSPCFYDSDVAGTTVTVPARTNLFSVTTAQAQDATYLQSIGFLVAQA
jgi:hypothetical protein